MGEVVQLRLALEQLDSEFQSAAEVCWTRPGKGNDWLMACAFRPQIPKQILDKLVICGLLEQRETIRQNVNLPVTIRWELGEGGKSAKLIDYSDGGFCLGTSYVVEAGQRLSMKIDRPEGRPLEVLAKVQWLLKTPDEHLLGCSLLGGDDIGCLRALDDSC